MSKDKLQLQKRAGGIAGQYQRSVETASKADRLKHGSEIVHDSLPMADDGREAVDSWGPATSHPLIVLQAPKASVLTGEDLKAWWPDKSQNQRAKALGLSVNTLKAYESSAKPLPRYITGMCLALDAGLLE